MMTRTSIYLNEVQMKKLKAIAKKSGFPVSEVTRRVLENWLEKQDEKKGLPLEEVLSFDDAKKLLLEIGGMKKKGDTKSKKKR